MGKSFSVCSPPPAACPSARERAAAGHADIQHMRGSLPSPCSLPSPALAEHQAGEN